MTKLITFIFATLLISITSQADISHAPPAFNYSDGKAIFVDFQKANYFFNFDVAKQTLNITSKIIFQTEVEGYPVFDQVPEPLSIKIDNTDTTQTLITSPERATKFRVINKKVSPGLHSLEITSTYKNDITFTANGVKTGFWTDDLSDRGFLEQYLPSSFEFDNVYMIFDVTVSGTNNDHDIFTNGTLNKLEQGHWKIVFPEYFNSSAMYFHMVPKNSFPTLVKTFKSIDGREIPLIIYGNANLQLFETTARKAINDLESRFGPWRHQGILIYAQTGGGGMEYCGATISSEWALPHELTHSYFARGMMPANGDAGWLDEALARWHDYGFGSVASPNFGITNMGKHSVYNRFTDMRAYDQGANFMAYLNFRASLKGGLQTFLNDLLKRRLFSPLQTQDFQKDLESFIGVSLAADFNEHIYGGGLDFISPNPEPVSSETPHHVKLTLRQRRLLL